MTSSDNRELRFEPLALFSVAPFTEQHLAPRGRRRGAERPAPVELAPHRSGTADTESDPRPGPVPHPMPGPLPGSAGGGSDQVGTASSTESMQAADVAQVAGDDGTPVWPWPIRAVRSGKRKRSVSARLIDGTLELRIPAWMSAAEELEWTERMARRFVRKRSNDGVDLEARCADLARRLDLPLPASIRWVSNQRDRWGSCTPATAAIRISDRLAGMPSWVLDYVLVHEMAHLRHPDHGRAFWTMVQRYPRTERARGYLQAVGMGEAGSRPDGDDGSGEG